MNGTWEAGDQLPSFDGLEVEEAKPETKTVGFSAALHCIIAGGAARREVWGDAAGLICLASRCSDETRQVAVDPFFAYVAGGKALVWTPSTNDLLADDWVPVTV